MPRAQERQREILILGECVMTEATRRVDRAPAPGPDRSRHHRHAVQHLEGAAIAYPEAPERLGALLKQRFRWSFGTLQCAWKHRAAMWQRSAGALGLVGMPNIWLFQLLFPLLAPAADVALLMALGRLAVEAPVLGLNTAWAHTAPVAWLYLAFLLVDFVTALLGLALERDEPLSQALLVPLQRIAYRQVLYIALLKAIRAAAKGWSPGWGKLERTGRVADLKADARLGSL